MLLGILVALILPRVPRFTCDRIAVLLVLLWAGLLAYLAALQHLSFNSHAYDLGIFDQVLWNSARGRLFENSIMADSPSFLGHHFSPLLLALVPIYWLLPSPITLLVAQALALALAGLAIYWLARDLLPGALLPLAVLLAYLLHPATAYVALFDFHEIALATPLLAFSLLFLLRHRYLPFAISLALAFLAKEEVGLIGAAMGLVLVLAQGKRIAGLALFAGGIAWTLLLTRYVIPSFHPSGKYFFDALYGDAGSPLAALRGFISEPGKLVNTVFSPAKQTYLQQLLLPLGGLPLLGWQGLLVAAPTMAYLLLAAVSPDDLIRYQYSAPLLPPLFAASVLALRFLHERLKPYWTHLSPALVAFTMAAAAFGAYFYGPLPLARGYDASRYSIAPRVAAAKTLFASIPPGASVIAQSDLVPQLSQRRTIQLLGLSDPELRPDYYVFDTKDGSSRWPLDSADQYAAALATVRTDAGYTVVGERQNYVLFRRQQPDIQRPLAETFGNQLNLAGYRLDTPQIRPGETVRLILFWRAISKPEADYTLFAHFVDGGQRRWGQRDGLPLGKYLPTSKWEPGKLLRGDWTVPVAKDVPPGTYSLRVGLYKLATMRGLPITTGTEPGADAVVIGPIEVIQR